jgi:A/G-specific adenine glycosylase
MEQLLAECGTRLLSWNQKNYRDLSFRRVSDPFWVLIACMLLRQTRSQQVDGVFPTLMCRYSDIEALASASLADLTKLLRPLGIRSRARQLRTVARILRDRYCSTVPNRVEELLKLPGVGPYVAGCVVSFCFGQEMPLVDTNVRRVISRILGSEGCSEKELEAAYLTMSAGHDRRIFHYAILDLAAALCRPRRPLCHHCPLSDLCLSATTRRPSSPTTRSSPEVRPSLAGPGSQR